MNADRFPAARLRPGFVSLVGAGPGDPGLLTRKAGLRLRQAEVVLYDRLVHHDVLRLAKKATLVPVGKKPGRPGELRQDRIQRLLIRYAHSGFRVVRLKGGDPFVFGRGGEEAMALAAAGVAFEVIPGVSSFHSAPALAGIPVTHRGLASGFGVFTAHEAESSSGIPWAAAAATPTAIFLMGVRNLPSIVSALLAYGRAENTPAALISRASWPDQRVVSACLSDIVQLAADLPAPAVLIVGEVVRLRGSIHTALDDLASDEEWMEILRGAAQGA